MYGHQEDEDAPKMLDADKDGQKRENCKFKNNLNSCQSKKITP